MTCDYHISEGILAERSGRKDFLVTAQFGASNITNGAEMTDEIVDGDLDQRLADTKQMRKLCTSTHDMAEQSMIDNLMQTCRSRSMPKQIVVETRGC